MITKKEVEYVANLARLELTEEEKETYTLQLAKILGHMEELNKLDTSGVTPTSHVLPMKNVDREDVGMPFEGREDILANAPETEGRYIKVRKIIE